MIVVADAALSLGRAAKCGLHGGRLPIEVTDMRDARGINVWDARELRRILVDAGPVAHLVNDRHLWEVDVRLANHNVQADSALK